MIEQKGIHIYSQVSPEAAIEFIYIFRHTSESFTLQYKNIPFWCPQNVIAGVQKLYKIFTLTLGNAKQCMATLEKNPYYRDDANHGETGEQNNSGK